MPKKGKKSKLFKLKDNVATRTSLFKYPPMNLGSKSEEGFQPEVRSRIAFQ